MKGSTEGLILSCEHGGNRIPAAFRRQFTRAGKVLATHRGYDIGALGVAKKLSSALDAPLVYSDVSRLLVDLNRSRHHQRLFSEFTRGCSKPERERILQQYYDSYRNNLEQLIRDKIRKGTRVLHLSIHSFTPKLDGEVRNADIGLLYDPARRAERDFCLQLQARLKTTGLRVRRNYPYRGNADGLTTYLRSVLPAKSYLGIEIEINQKLLAEDGKRIGQLLDVLKGAGDP